MKNIYKIKKQQLGMNPSTASGRLLKDILFKLIQQTQQDYCFHCNEELTRETFSVEHQVPWLHSSDPLELYFDLQNISFSHLKCNIKSARRVSVSPLRKIGPKGTAWCSTCKDFFDVDNFCKNSTRWNKLTSECKKCQKKYRDFKKYGKVAESGLKH